jgi:hypothetical protein
MRAIKKLFKRGQKASHLFLLGSVMSCSSAHVKRPNLQSIQEKSVLRMEIMRLWAKVEYRRLLGDEISAQAYERDLLILEDELALMTGESQGTITSREL